LGRIPLDPAYRDRDFALVRLPIHVNPQLPHVDERVRQIWLIASARQIQRPIPELDASIFGRDLGMEKIMKVRDPCGRASIRSAVIQRHDWMFTHILAEFQNASDVMMLHN
jgi:hypothetical protein